MRGEGGVAGKDKLGERKALLLYVWAVFHRIKLLTIATCVSYVAQVMTNIPNVPGEVIFEVRSFGLNEL